MGWQALGRWHRGDCVASMRPAPLSHILAGSGADGRIMRKDRGPGFRPPAFSVFRVRLWVGSGASLSVPTFPAGLLCALPTIGSHNFHKSFSIWQTLPPLPVVFYPCQEDDTQNMLPPFLPLSLFQNTGAVLATARTPRTKVTEVSAPRSGRPEGRLFYALAGIGWEASAFCAAFDAR